MHTLAQPTCSSLQRADSSRESAGAGIRVRSEDPATEIAALPRTEIFMPTTVALHLRKDADWAAARRCRMTTGAAAGTPVLPPTVLFSRMRPPRGKPGAGSPRGRLCITYRRRAAAAYAETESSSGAAGPRDRWPARKGDNQWPPSPSSSS